MSEGRLASFEGATGWLNSEPLTVESLRGKVVLVDFWTFTCINWLRTEAAVRGWAEKYAGRGLVVIGVHTPEFPFEADRDNVERAVAERRIAYPVALDPEYAVWEAFGNHYWPAIYLADADGRIQHHHFGEGGEEQTERVIQKLLREAGHDVGGELLSVTAEGVEAPADWSRLESGETYLGIEQGRRFADGGEAAFGQQHEYTPPDALELNSWALSGEWTIGDRAITLKRAGGGIVFRFHARDANVVLRSSSNSSIPFRVLVDGRPPGAAHGVDVDETGHGVLTEPRLYQLVRQEGLIVDRTLELDFHGAGVEAYVFTFG